MSGDVIFGVVFGLVAVGLIVWVVVIVLRARSVTGASDERLNSRLYAALNNLPQDDASIPKKLPPAPGKAPVDPADAAPSGPKEARLAELSDLHARGLISDDELAAARAKILAE